MVEEGWGLPVVIPQRLANRPAAREQLAPRFGEADEFHDGAFLISLDWIGI